MSYAIFILADNNIAPRFLGSTLNPKQLIFIRLDRADFWGGTRNYFRTNSRWPGTKGLHSFHLASHQPISHYDPFFQAVVLVYPDDRLEFR